MYTLLFIINVSIIIIPLSIYIWQVFKHKKLKFILIKSFIFGFIHAFLLHLIFCIGEWFAEMRYYNKTDNIFIIIIACLIVGFIGSFVYIIIGLMIYYCKKILIYNKK